MKEVFLLLTANISSLAAIIGATILAYNRLSGWGWFLFIAVLVHSIPKSSKQTKENEEENKRQLLLEGE